MAIDTTKVTDRRPLRFESYDQVLADAERLASSEVRPLGNWQLGNALGHLAASMNASIDGIRGTVPWYRRWVAWFFRGWILQGSMPAGIQLPEETQREIVPEGEVTGEEGLASLRKAIERLRTVAERKPHLAFGDMTRDEWDLLHYRHCELHLSFFVEAKP